MDVTPASTATVDEDFSDLDALLSEAKAERQEKTLQREVRARQARQQLTPEDLLRLAAWEAAQWTRVANVALFETQICECGFEHNLFTGLFAEETHKSLHNGERRWVPAESALKDLPNIVRKRIKFVAMCDICALEKGWDTNVYQEWMV